MEIPRGFESNISGVQSSFSGPDHFLTSLRELVSLFNSSSSYITYVFSLVPHVPFVSSHCRR